MVGRNSVDILLIDEGGSLLSKLDFQSPFVVDAAYWAPLGEDAMPKLVLQFREFKTKGPVELYRAIQKLLRKAPAAVYLNLRDITVVGPDDPATILVSKMNVAIRKAWLVSHSPDIPWTYIYRLN